MVIILFYILKYKRNLYFEKTRHIQKWYTYAILFSDYYFSSEIVPDYSEFEVPTLLGELDLSFIFDYDC